MFLDILRMFDFFQGGGGEKNCFKYSQNVQKRKKNLKPFLTPQNYNAQIKKCLQQKLFAAPNNLEMYTFPGLIDHTVIQWVPTLMCTRLHCCELALDSVGFGAILSHLNILKH